MNAGVNEVFMHLYSLMSLSTHPSNITVFQYAQMFEKNFDAEMTFTFLGYSKIIMAFMIADYCKYFPIAKEKFLELPEINQLLVDSLNGTFRGRDFEISGLRNKYMAEFQVEFEKLINNLPR